MPRRIPSSPCRARYEREQARVGDVCYENVPRYHRYIRDGADELPNALTIADKIGNLFADISSPARATAPTRPQTPRQRTAPRTAAIPESGQCDARKHLRPGSSIPNTPRGGPSQMSGTPPQPFRGRAQEVMRALLPTGKMRKGNANIQSNPRLMPRWMLHRTSSILNGATFITSSTGMPTALSLASFILSSRSAWTSYQPGLPISGHSRMSHSVQMTPPGTVTRNIVSVLFIGRAQVPA